MMSEQQENNSGKQSEEGERTSDQGKESEIKERHPTLTRESSVMQPAYAPARDTHSTFFEASPLESPLLPETSHPRTPPRHFNPPLPVSPSSSIFRKDSKKKTR